MHKTMFSLPFPKTSMDIDRSANKLNWYHWLNKTEPEWEQINNPCQETLFLARERKQQTITYLLSTEHFFS